MKKASGLNEENKAKIIILTCLVLLLVVSFCSLFLGRFSNSPGEVIDVFKYKLFGIGENSRVVTIVWDIRLPRLLLNILVGAGLSVAGAAFQGIFQNRLVSPDILGVSNGAGFGAALGIFLASGLNYMVAPMAFVCGLVSVFMTFSIYKMKREQSVLYLVLSGIIVGSMFNALISMLKLVADTDSVLPSITYWLMGSFTSSSYSKVVLAGIPILIGTVVLILYRWRINILSMGDKEAFTLGVQPKQTRLIIIGACTLITAACVTVSGIIGWVGMIIPNICREYVSGDNRYLIPASIVIGALFMVLADLVARTITPAEIPIGIITALIGGPLFIFVYKRSGGE